MLVETAFISNPDEEKTAYASVPAQPGPRHPRRRVKRFATRQASSAPPPKPITVEPKGRPREHVDARVAKRLASIARQYNLHVEALRFFNSLPETEPPVGTRLRPAAGGGQLTVCLHVCTGALVRYDLRSPKMKNRPQST